MNIFRTVSVLEALCSGFNFCVCVTFACSLKTVANYFSMAMLQCHRVVIVAILLAVFDVFIHMVGTHVASFHRLRGNVVY